MDQWLIDLLALFPDGSWETRRRQIILFRWPDDMVRAADQDARMGKPEDLARYDAEVQAIKAALPKV